MADRLLAAGFPRGDVQVLTLTPRVGSLVARLRGTDSTLRPILLMAHLDVVPARREDWSIDPFTLWWTPNSRSTPTRARRSRRWHRRRHDLFQEVPMIRIA